MQRDDEHEVRAREMALFDPKRAAWIRYCQHPSHTEKKSCRLRMCPTCSKGFEQHKRSRVLAEVEKMTNPTLFLGQVYSLRINSRRDLNMTLDALRDAFVDIYDRHLRRSATTAIGCIEVVPTGDMQAWNAHLHLVADVHAGIDVPSADDHWREFVSPRHGMFGTDGAVKNREAIASYISKRESWSPEPGTLPPYLLCVLFSAIRGRRLLVSRRRRRTSRRLGCDLGGPA